MPESDELSDFQPERVRTYSTWRLRNFSPPVNEEEFRNRLADTAAEANGAFDAFLSRLNQETKSHR